MIQKFVDLWDKNKEQLRDVFKERHPLDYAELLKEVITILQNHNYNDLDPERIHPIDDGDYQGTLLFIIGVKGYQPSDYYFVKISYGSCFGCDTLERIRDYSSDTPTESQVNDYMTLALHIVQNIKTIEGEAI